VVPSVGLAPGRRDRLVAVYRALGDPTRLEVFRLIAAQTAPLCVCDIVARFELSQPTISHHLKILRDAGLVTVSRRGVWAYYSVDPAGLALLRGALAELAPGLLADVS
jgi:ArsR family transcriptional regulator